MKLLKINFIICDNINILEEINIDFIKNIYEYKLRKDIFPKYILFGINYDINMQKKVANFDLKKKTYELKEKENILKEIKEEKLVEKFLKNNTNETIYNMKIEIEYDDNGKIKKHTHKYFYNYSIEDKNILDIFIKYNKDNFELDILNEKNKIYQKSISKILINSINKEDINLSILKKAYNIYIESNIEISYIGNFTYLLSLITKEGKFDFEAIIFGGSLVSVKSLNERAKEEHFLAYIFLLNEFEQKLDSNLMKLKNKKENKFKEKDKKQNRGKTNILDILKGFLPFLKSSKKMLNKEILLNLISSEECSNDERYKIQDIFNILNEKIDFDIKDFEKINLINFFSIYSLILENNNIIKHILLKQDVYDLINLRILKENELKKDFENINSNLFRSFKVKIDIKKGSNYKYLGKIIDFNIYKIKEEVFNIKNLRKLIKKNIKTPKYNVIILDEDMENIKENEVTIIGSIKIKEKVFLLGLFNISSLDDLDKLKIYVSKIITNIYKDLKIEDINLPNIFKKHILDIIKKVDLNYLEKYIKKLSKENINKLKYISELKDEDNYKYYKQYLKNKRSFNEYLWHKEYILELDNTNNEKYKDIKKDIKILDEAIDINLDFNIYKDLENELRKQNENEKQNININLTKDEKDKDDSIKFEEQIIISKYGK